MVLAMPFPTTDAIRWVIQLTIGTKVFTTIHTFGRRTKTDERTAFVAFHRTSTAEVSLTAIFASSPHFGILTTAVTNQFGAIGAIVSRLGT